MPKNLHSQPPSTRRYALFTDAETHSIITGFAKDQGKTIIRVVYELVHSNTKIVRFIEKSASQQDQSTQSSATVAE